MMSLTLCRVGRTGERRGGAAGVSKMEPSFLSFPFIPNLPHASRASAFVAVGGRFHVGISVSLISRSLFLGTLTCSPLLAFSY